MPIRGEGREGREGLVEASSSSSPPAEESGRDQKMVYVLHPNCAVEDI